MRYPASEKLEIIGLVERSHLPARRTLEKLSIPRATFNRWYDRLLTGGVEALEDRRPRPKRVWNRIPEDVRARIVELALNRPELSPRELPQRMFFGFFFTMAVSKLGSMRASFFVTRLSG